MRWILRMSIPASAVLLLLQAAGAAAQGTEFNLSCDANEVLVGISGRQAWWMSGIAARCRTVNANGALGDNVRSTEYRGGAEGVPGTFDCAPAEVMVGYGGLQGSSGHVLYVHELICAPWQANTRTAGTPTRTESAFDVKSGSGERIAASCLEGRLGTRVRGRAGQYLDRLIDIGCSYATGASPPLYGQERLGERSNNEQE